MSTWQIVVVSLVALGLIAWLLFVAIRRNLRHRLARATDEFKVFAKAHCVKFREVAAATGKPRGLRWKQCDYADEELFAVNRKSGDLYALVSVLISFEAIEGGPMEDAEAAGDLRAATAVFVYRTGAWTTEGRVLFNLSPRQAIDRFGETLEPWTKQS